MAINYKSINYGLPGRYPKLSKRKGSLKKTIYSKCMLKSVELFNPEPMPYQKDSFKPCTVSRLIDIPRRINDGFIISDEIGVPRQRGIILHRDRYDWSSMKDILRNQNERLVAEENHIKKIKFFKNLSEQKLKSSNHNLMLEGEHMLPLNIQEKNESKKERYPNFIEENCFRNTAPSMVTNYNTVVDVLETIDSQQLVSMDVHRIKLKNRQFGGENISSAPVQTQKDRVNMDQMQNMFLAQDGRDSFDRLPPITNKNKESDLSNSQSDFAYAFRQSERLNRPNVRLNEYVVDAVPVKFMERADIQAELRCLKSMALPTTARDLFIGRGIHLPSSHAMQNPRGKYIMDSDNFVSEMMKIDTPGGGSVTINTKTPPNKNLVPDNSPMLKNQSDYKKKDDEQLQQEKIKEMNNIEEEKYEEIFSSLSLNSEGYADSTKFVQYLNNIEELSTENIKFLSSIFQSLNTVTKEQVTVVLESIDTFKIISDSFEENLIPIDDEKMNFISQPILNLLDNSKNWININRFYEWITAFLDPSLTQEKCQELLSSFQEKIKLDGRLNEETIEQIHILPFIIYFFLMGQRN